MTSECPDPETLQKLLLGDLPASQREKLGKHLLECDQCVATSDTIIARDDLTEAIRVRRVINDDDQECLSEVIERGMQLRGDSPNSLSNETVDVENVPSMDVTHDSSVGRTSAKLEVEADFLADPEQPDEIGRLGGYRVLEVMGAGGMGIVFKAEDPKLERLVALKAMKPAVAASRTSKERFLREAKATAAIDHHNIVHIYQVGEDRHVPFIAMQFLQGESLQHRLTREGKLDQRDVLRIGQEVAAGLQAAHETGLIHRDIKPDNIWIDEKSGSAKILDFGLVRSFSDDAGLTHSGMIVGTPRYMAPEQAQGQVVDHRSDLFSLGSVLYHLATGRPAFDGSNLTATLIAVAQADPQDVTQVSPDLHPDLARLIMRLLSKEKEDRPQSASEVAEVLKAIEKRIDEAPAVDRKIQPRSTPRPKPVRKPKHKPQPSRFGGGITNTRKLLIGGGFAAMILLAGIIFKFNTANGTVVVELDGLIEIATVEIDDKEVSFSPDGTEKRLTFQVDPGTHELTIKTADGLELTTDLGAKPLEITAGGNTMLRAWVEKSSKKTVNVNPDRAVAEWVLSMPQGQRSVAVSIAGKNVLISDLDELPKDTFSVYEISITHVGDTVLTDSDLNRFISLTNLQGITLGDIYATPTGMITEITDAGIAKLCEMPNLNRLAHLHIQAPKVTNASIPYLNRMRSMTTMTLNGTQITDDGLRELRLPTLLRVGLSGVSLGGFDGFLQRLPNLKLIHLGGENQLTAADFSPFIGWTHPDAWLRLNATGLDDDGMRSLGQLTNFSGRIELAGNHFTDIGIGHLESLKHLRELNISENDLTEAGVRKLQTALPNCKIISDFDAAMTATTDDGKSATYPRPEYDPSPLPKLGTWEPFGTADVTKQFPGSKIAESETLPGLAMRPAKLTGIGRWNVATQLPPHSAVAEFSPDDKLLAVGSTDGHVRIYDAETLELKQLLPGLSGGNGVLCLDWHPDGKSLAANSPSTNALTIWTVDGTIVSDGATGRFPSMQFSPDGERLATANEQGQIHLRKPDGTILHVVQDDSSRGVSLHDNLAWSPDSQLFATLHSDNKLRIWSRDGDLKSEVDGFGSFAYPGYSIQWSPTGEWIGVVDGSKPNEIQRIAPDGSRGEPITVLAHGLVNRFRWAPDGQHMYAATHYFVRSINLKTNEVRDHQQLGGAAMCLNHAGTRIATLQYSLKLLDSELNILNENPLASPAYCIEWNRKGDAFALASDRKFSLWDQTGRRVAELGASHGAGPAIAWHPDGERIALSAGQLNSMWLGKVSEELTQIKPLGYYRLSWSSDGKFVVGASYLGKRFDILDASGKVLKQIDCPADRVHVDFHPDRNLLAVTAGAELFTCSPTDEWKLRSVMKLEKGTHDGRLAWSSDGEKLFVEQTGILAFDEGTFSLARSSDYLGYSSWRTDDECLVKVNGTELWLLDKYQKGPISRVYFDVANSLSIDAHPTRDLFTTTHSDATIISWDADAMEPYWRAVMLPGDKSVTITAAGQILPCERAIVDEHLVYYVENDDGRIETLTPTEFETRIGQSLFALEQAAPLDGDAPAARSSAPADSTSNDN